MRATIERTPLLRAAWLDADPCATILRLDATDGALALTQAIPAAVDGGWRRAVAARPLAALVTDLPNGSLTLAALAAASGAALALGAGNFCAVLPALHHDAVPAVPEAGPRCTLPLDDRRHRHTGLPGPPLGGQAPAQSPGHRAGAAPTTGGVRLMRRRIPAAPPRGPPRRPRDPGSRAAPQRLPGTIDPAPPIPRATTRPHEEGAL